MSNFKYFARVAGVLFIVCTITALLLGAVYGLTKDTIQKNNDKVMRDTIASVFEGDIMIKEAIITEGLDPCVKNVYEITEHDYLLGYAVHVAPLGFKGEIEMIVGLQADGSCKSVRIISLSETPGLGSKVSDDIFLSQFTGKNEVFTVKENIDPIASATISSKAVANGVNIALDAYEIVTGGKS
ncbi:MAG: FMN-binding protein [Clostridia bacterium]|nr:FMN-binding protein [Clostridia bacterium]